MKRKNTFTYSLNFFLTKYYLEVIILCLERKILNEKVDVLFVFLFYRIHLFYTALFEGLRYF